MKKTLAAVAVLGAFAGSALAADVTLYGKVDLGLQYTHTDNGDETVDSWGVKSGGNSSSRFGFKGSEQISEGLTVGFQLEHGFNADDASETKLFSRESRLYVATDYGTLHMGRFGRLDGGTGSLDLLGDMTASGTGYGDYVADLASVFYVADPAREANSIAYVSPEFAGMKVSAMASLGKDTKVGDVTYAEGSSKVDRYYGLGVEGNWGALGAGLVVSMEDFGSKATDATGQRDDSTNVTAGVNYDFGVAKAFFAANYYDYGMKTDKKQWGVVVGSEAAVGAGSLEVSVGYGEVSEDEVKDIETVMFGAMYTYPLSKRTFVYAGAGYTQEDNGVDDKVKGTQVMSGICHNF